MIQVFTEEVIGEELNHEYDLDATDDFSILSYSNDSNWTDAYRGQECALLINTGDGFEISLEDEEESIYLDYTQAQQVLILLLQNNDAVTEFREVTVTKRID